MQPPDLHQLEVGRSRPRQLHRNIGFQPQHIGRMHGASHVDQQLGKAALEFHRARRDPEGAETFGDGQPHFAGDGGIDAVARANQAEGRRLHALGGGEDFLAFLGDADAVDMAGDQRDAELVLQVLHMPAQGVDRLAEMLGGGAEAAPAHDLQEQAYPVPILNGTPRTGYAVPTSRAPGQLPRRLAAGTGVPRPAYHSGLGRGTPVLSRARLHCSAPPHDLQEQAYPVPILNGTQDGNRAGLNPVFVLRNTHVN